MRFLFFAALTSLLAGLAPAAAQSNDAFNLRIEVGRWGVMLGAVAEHGPDLSAPRRSEEDNASLRSMTRQLRETVWELNLQRSRLCAEGKVTQVSCRPAYAPAWLKEQPNAAPSLHTLEQRSAAVGREVMPLWDAVCEAAGAGITDPDERRALCPME